MLVPQEDGVTHINVYSQGRTRLGKWMSNWAREPIETEDGEFASIEAYWFWLGTRNEALRPLYGYQAKKVGGLMPKIVTLSAQDFRAKIKAAILAKAKKRPDMVAALKATKLPLEHYYVYGNKVIDAGYKWILEIWEEIRAS